MKPRLLVVANGIVPSGYEKVARGLLKPLCDFFDVHQVAIGYRGAPCHEPWMIYPTHDADRYGAQTYTALHAALKPDLSLFINDGWALHQYPVLPNQWAYVAIDAPYMVHTVAHRINKLTGVIFHTQFAKSEALKASVDVPMYVISHGHDPQFKPLPKQVVRKSLNIDEDLFIVGNINANQKRKRFDLTLHYFAEWVKRFDLPKSVRLYLQPLKNAAQGIPIYLYAERLGILDRLFSTPIEQNKFIPDDQLVILHNVLDVQMNTSSGESWGLCTMDGMMCNIAQIVPEWAGIGEWTKDGAVQIPCTNVEVSHLGSIGGIADKDLYIQALQDLYIDHTHRNAIRQAGRQLAELFHWDQIASQFHKAFSS